MVKKSTNAVSDYHNGNFVVHRNFKFEDLLDSQPSYTKTFLSSILAMYTLLPSRDEGVHREMERGRESGLATVLALEW